MCSSLSSWHSVGVQAVSVTADEDLPPELAQALKAEQGAALQASSLQMLMVRPSTVAVQHTSAACSFASKTDVCFHAG